MKDDKRRRQTQRMRWGAGLLIFLIINLVLRMSIIGINEAEYTDGILQLTQFQEFTGIYPPLYTCFTWPLSFIMGQLWAGRLVSVLFSTAAVIPLYLMALRSLGMRAAVFTALVYTVAPVSLRWAPRVMTDATFSFFFWFACERLVAAQGALNSRDANIALGGAAVFGAFSAMTRYQGLMFLPVILFVALYLYHSKKIIAWKGLLFLGLYISIPIWDYFAGNIHGQQFLERSAALGPWKTFILTSEPFLLSVPYFLTYPVFFLAMLGAFVGKARRRFWLTPIVLYVLVVLLIFQSLFASFQERYFLPFYGLMYIWAGLGLAVVDDRCRRKYPRLRLYAPIGVVCWCLFISSFVLVGGRAVFGDVRRAAELAGELAEEETTIYTNEIYRMGASPAETIAGNKVEFFAGRPVEYLDPVFYVGGARLAPGDLIVLTSRDDLNGQIDALSNRYDLEIIGAYEAVTMPVFPDIMQNRGVEQSPAAWLYRYEKQRFSTTVLLVKGLRAGR